MPTPNVRIVMKSGHTFDVNLTKIEVTKNTNTQRITNIDYTWGAGVMQPWVYIDLNEIAAIIDIPAPTTAPEIPTRTR